MTSSERGPIVRVKSRPQISKKELAMASTAIRVFTAGPYPVLQSARVDHNEQEVDLDVALLIEGLPNILASTTFPLDETWERILSALTSGDAKLGVAGL